MEMLIWCEICEIMAVHLRIFAIVIKEVIMSCLSLINERDTFEYTTFYILHIHLKRH